MFEMTLFRLNMCTPPMNEIYKISHRLKETEGLFGSFLNTFLPSEAEHKDIICLSSALIEVLIFKESLRKFLKLLLIFYFFCQD